MLEMTYRCAECGAVTANPTRVHVCPECNRQVCSSCLGAHQAAHRAADPEGGQAQPGT